MLAVFPTWRLVSTCILAGPLHRIDFWSATGFTLPVRKGRPHLRTVGRFITDRVKRFSLSASLPPSRLLLLSSWKTCQFYRLPRESKETMANMTTTAWRLLCCDMAGTQAPIPHSTRRHGFPGVTGLLSEPSGREGPSCRPANWIHASGRP